MTSADVSGSWSYNTNNELLGYADVEYTYDENGNMTQKKIGTAAVNYIYDAANRLVKVENDATQTVIAEYYYDPFGRRLWKEVGGTRTYFFYSEEGLIAEYDATGTEIRSYGYQPDSTWTTDPLFLKEGGTYYWYQNDHLGTPQKLMAQDGTVVWSAQYNAFGEADVQDETITNNLRFPGQYFDEETGLHYNLHRYYNPKIGRYLRVDPIGRREGKNLFSYALNNPMKSSDPLGLWVHPHQIVPPAEARDGVSKSANMFNSYVYPGIFTAVDQKINSFIAPFWIFDGLSNSVHQKMLKSSQSFLDYKNGMLLFYLARENWTGGYEGTGRPGAHNRFVFTCQHGWIDMGHFFQTATLGYLLEKAGMPDNANNITIYGGEYFQYLELVIRESFNLPMGFNADSAFTPEDIPSNTQGTLFGREVAREGPGSDVAGKFEQRLKDWGAVDYRKEDVDIYRDLLQEDVIRWWGGNYDLTTNENKEDPNARFSGPRDPWYNVKFQTEAYCTICCRCYVSEHAFAVECGDRPFPPYRPFK